MLVKPIRCVLRTAAGRIAGSDVVRCWPVTTGCVVGLILVIAGVIGTLSIGEATGLSIGAIGGRAGGVPGSGGVVGTGSSAARDVVGAGVTPVAFGSSTNFRKSA